MVGWDCASRFGFAVFGVGRIVMFLESIKMSISFYWFSHRNVCKDCMGFFSKDFGLVLVIIFLIVYFLPTNTLVFFFVFSCNYFLISNKILPIDLLKNSSKERLKF